jgi:acyl-CoA synthetase (AMP-forming)/AMP-acid ligase II
MAQNSFVSVGKFLDQAAAKIGRKDGLCLVGKLGEDWDFKAQGVKEEKVDQRFNYSQFDKQSSAIAGGMASIGLRPGDTVATLLPHSLENVVTQFGAAKAGLKIASMEPGADSAFVQKVLGECTAIVYDPALLQPALVGNFDCKHAISTGLKHVKRVKGRHRFAEILLYSPFKPARVTPDTVLYTAYTGEECTPSETMTHGEVIAAAEAMVEELELTSRDKVCVRESPQGFGVAYLAAVMTNSTVMSLTMLCMPSLMAWLTHLLDRSHSLLDRSLS